MKCLLLVCYCCMFDLTSFVHHKGMSAMSSVRSDEWCVKSHIFKIQFYINRLSMFHPRSCSLICRDRISSRSQGKKFVWLWGSKIWSLLFADDVVLLASSVNDLQHTLERLTDECETAGMKTGTSKSEAMVLCQRLVAHSGGSCSSNQGVQVPWGLVHEWRTGCLGQHLW